MSTFPSPLPSSIPPSLPKTNPALLTLPSPLAITTIASGALISIFGHYVPILLTGGAITTIGMGMIYTLEIGSNSSHWIGYQVLAGLGVGFAFQVPQIVAQSICGLDEVSHYTAISLCVFPPRPTQLGEMDRY